MTTMGALQPPAPRRPCPVTDGARPGSALARQAAPAQVFDFRLPGLVGTCSSFAPMAQAVLGGSARHQSAGRAGNFHLSTDGRLLSGRSHVGGETFSAVPAVGSAAQVANGPDSSRGPFTLGIAGAAGSFGGPRDG
jgi:hypothetical protein